MGIARLLRHFDAGLHGARALKLAVRLCRDHQTAAV
jgi:hypothetical protein